MDFLGNEKSSFPSRNQNDHILSLQRVIRSICNRPVCVCVCARARARVYIYIYIYTVYGAQLVEALRYKPEGRGFDSRGVIGIFH